MATDKANLAPDADNSNCAVYTEQATHMVRTTHSGEKIPEIFSSYTSLDPLSRRFLVAQKLTTEIQLQQIHFWLRKQ